MMHTTDFQGYQFGFVYICRQLKLDIPEGFESPAAKTAVLSTEIGVLQDFALNVQRALATLIDNEDGEAFQDRIEELLDGLHALCGDTMIEDPIQ